MQGRVDVQLGAEAYALELAALRGSGRLLPDSNHEGADVKGTSLGSAEFIIAG